MRSGVDMHSADNRWGVVGSGRACSLHLHAGVGYISVRIWTVHSCSLLLLRMWLCLLAQLPAERAQRGHDHGPDAAGGADDGHALR